MTLSAGSPPRQGRRYPAGMCLINKPVGLTSFAALAAVKRSLATSRVGHAGTLDRFASGLLIAFSGSYCRLAGFAEAGEKVYRGRIAFGRETSTLDPEGETVAEGPIPDPGKLASALESFRGPIVQRPPLYSAVHIDGRRAYERARAGEVPVMPERRVTILELRLESYAMGVAQIYVRCTPGTYIRSLARDIARSCDSYAHLAGLERLAIGPFRLEDARSPEEFLPERDLRALDPAAAAQLGLVAATVDPAYEARFTHGALASPEALQPLVPDTLREGKVCAVFDSAGGLLGLVELRGAGLEYRAVLAEQGEERSP